jgi:outer membrane protein OmpA-like peptidoglycan-associated protein
MNRYRAMTRHPDMTRYLSALVLAIGAALVAPHARAEKVIVYREGQLVQPQDVANVLGNTRSIRLLDDAPAAPPAKARPQAKAEATALSLPVRFDFDSTEILPSARAQLDALAAGIKLLPSGRIVTVQGHTDATGSDEYNLELSQERAVAVRDYLVQHHGIDPARLKTVGYGKQRPIESDPYAAVNRRVQFEGS